MELNNERILAEKLLLLTRIDYDERLIGEFAEAIRSYRTEIEKEFTPRVERTTNIDTDYPLRKIDTKAPYGSGVVPEWVFGATDKRIDNPERIAEK